MTDPRPWPMHYTLSRPAWFRRWIVWRHLPLRRIEGEIFEWEVVPSMRFWRYSMAHEVVTACNKAQAKKLEEPNRD